ncbi:MAG: glutamyl-tRNA reductase [Actinobacteria bacterium]|nr:glutamyl-tRNA reductase [Actinomycetota bacterium]
MASPIVVVGTNHKTAPIELLERLSIPTEQLPKALEGLAGYEHVLEGVVVSTCNRSEVYAVVSKFHAGVANLRDFLAEFCHIAPEDFADHLYTYHDDAAVRHLFRVASGIDSMIIGESEILGQVRRAYQAALDHDAAGRVLGAAFRSALRAGKRARTETAIARNPASMSSAALTLARGALGDLAGKNVAVLGAGEMGRLAAHALVRAGASRITVVNRSEDRGESLALAFGAPFRRLEELDDVIAGADVLVCSTTATRAVVDEDLVRVAGERRAGEAPLVIVDMAVPRDVDPAVARAPGVLLYDISDLQRVVEGGVGARVEEIVAVESIIEGELERFLQWAGADDIGPTVAALIATADAIRAEELGRLKGAASLSAEQEAAVELATKRIVNKLLHLPLQRARELSASKQGYVYLNAIRELFGPDDPL